MSARERRRKRRRLGAGAGLAVGAALATAPGAQAVSDTFTVDLDDDPVPSGGCTVGGCTLREAVTAANADNDATDQDKIVFSATLTGNTITLGSPLPIVDESLWIQGLGAANLTVSGNTSHILYVRTPVADAIKVSDVTLTAGAGLDGPAINLRDTDGSTAGSPSLTVQDATLTGNTTGGVGGAISAYLAGDVSIVNSIISNNAASGQGGGVYLRSGESLSIQNSTISGNHTGGDFSPGGGVYSLFTPVTIQDSTVSGNYTTGLYANGGGLAKTYGDLTIENSTVSGNHTGGTYAGGGGLSQVYDSATVESSTFSGNYTNGTLADGGGVYSYRGAATSVRNSTIASNNAGSGGGGIYVNDNSDPTLANTIVADNTADSGPDLRGLGTFQAAFSLIEDSSDATVNASTPGTNITGIDPMLLGLATNSSLNGTKTQALDPASPAIDCGSSGGVTTDQRGLTRPVDLSGRSNPTGGDGSDIGAFEVQLPETGSGACTNNAPSPPPGQNPPAPAALAPTFNLKAAIAKCKRKFPKGPKRKKCIRKAKQRAAATV